MDTTVKQDIYKRSRFLYIIEAAVEYFVTILVGGAFLAKLTDAVGMSDGMTAVLAAFNTLGGTFQFAAILLARKTPVKWRIIPMQILSQLLFALIYLTPFFPVPTESRSLLLLLFLLGGHILTQIIYSPKMNWFMSLVPDETRGVFTAKKEIVSLIGGMAFTTVMGNLIDIVEARGNIELAFILCAVTVCTLMVTHSLLLIFSREKPQEKQPPSLKDTLPDLMRNKKFIAVAFVSVFWTVVNNAAIPFYATYQNKELGFSLGTVALIAAIGSVTRALASIPMGKLADRFSFTNMLCICYGIKALAFAVAMFTVPQNGFFFFLMYTVLSSTAMAGINSGQSNLIYDFVDTSRRTAALAIKNTVAGIFGFLTTVLVTLLFNKIQENGLTVLGQPVYAQQAVSAIALALTLLLLLYLNTVVRRIKR